jgi:transketolase C-terminal domain/subunit
MTSKTLELAEAEEIKSVDLYSFPTISPLKKEWLNVLDSYKCIIVVEEHIAAGGLGSAILRALSGLTTKVMLLTASEGFHSKIGSYEWTLKARNLSSEAIAQKINQILLAQGSS